MLENSSFQKPLLKTGEVAQYLGVSRAMAYKLMQSGEIRSVHIGRSVRTRPESLKEYLARHEETKPKK